MLRVISRPICVPAERIALLNAGLSIIFSSTPGSGFSDCLGIGEAIVTVLSERGAPTPVAWTRLRPPQSLMDTIGPDYIKAAAQASPLFLKYGQTVDRESAYEMLAAKLAPPVEEPVDLPPLLPTGIDLPPMPKQAQKAEPGMLEQMMDNPAFKSAMRSAGTVIGREITRSIFGTGRRRR